MAIHLATLDLKRDVAAGFAKLRAKLLPEKKMDEQARQMQALQGLYLNAPWPSQLQSALMPSNNPFLHPLQANAAYGSYYPNRDPFGFYW